MKMLRGGLSSCAQSISSTVWASRVSRIAPPGRKDESGDFTKGAGLNDHQIQTVFSFVIGGADPNQTDFFQRLKLAFEEASEGWEGGAQGA